MTPHTDAPRTAPRGSVRTSPARAEGRTRLVADDRRDQIVAAARTLFAERAYDQVSTSDISRAAGTTRTNIHYHFSTKRDLFLEVVGDFSRFPEPFAGDDPDRSVEERVSMVFSRWLDAVDRNRQTFLTILHAGSSSDQQVSGVLLDGMRMWEKRLSVVVGMDPADPAHHALIRAFQSLVADLVAAWLEDRGPDKSQVHATLTDCLIALGTSAHRS